MTRCELLRQRAIHATAQLGPSVRVGAPNPTGFHVGILGPRVGCLWIHWFARERQHVVARFAGAEFVKDP